MFVCKKCSSKESVKAGFNGGKQRYKCKECGKVQVVGDERVIYEKEYQQKALILYLENAGIRTIGRVLSIFYKKKIYYQTVLKWLKKAGEILEENLQDENNKEIKKAEVLEIDELHTYIKKNPKMAERKLGYGLQLIGTEMKLLRLCVEMERQKQEGILE